MKKTYLQTLLETPGKSALIFFGIFLLGIILRSGSQSEDDILLKAATSFVIIISIGLIAYKKPAGWGWMATFFYFLLASHQAGALFIFNLAAIFWSIHTMICWKIEREVES